MHKPYFAMIFVRFRGGQIYQKMAKINFWVCSVGGSGLTFWQVVAVKAIKYLKSVGKKPARFITENLIFRE